MFWLQVDVLKLSNRPGKVKSSFRTRMTDSWLYVYVHKYGLGWHACLRRLITDIVRYRLHARHRARENGTTSSHSDLDLCPRPLTITNLWDCPWLQVDVSSKCEEIPSRHSCNITVTRMGRTDVRGQLSTRIWDAAISSQCSIFCLISDSIMY